MLQVCQIILPEKLVQLLPVSVLSFTQPTRHLILGRAATITQEVFSVHCPSVDDMKFTLFKLCKRGRQVHYCAIQRSLLPSSGSVSTAAKIRA